MKIHVTRGLGRPCGTEHVVNLLADVRVRRRSRLCCRRLF